MNHPKVGINILAVIKSPLTKEQKSKICRLQVKQITTADYSFLRTTGSAVSEVPSLIFTASRDSGRPWGVGVGFPLSSLEEGWSPIDLFFLPSLCSKPRFPLSFSLMMIINIIRIVIIMLKNNKIN